MTGTAQSRGMALGGGGYFWMSFLCLFEPAAQVRRE